MYKLSFSVFLSLILSITISKGQSIQIVEGDTLFLCQPGLVTLHAVTTGVDTSELVSSIELNSQDDVYSGIIDIGFPFVFYGNTYTQCLLSTNGYITFDLSNAGMNSPWVIPLGTSIPDLFYPSNSIFGPWQDLYPGAPTALSPGYVSYATTGTAPNRKFIFNLCEVPMYSCTQEVFSGQIILYETTNYFEFHITEKVVCPNWNSGQAVMGCQNEYNNLGTAMYNSSTQWTATNQAWRMIPVSTTNYTFFDIPYDPIPVYVPNQLIWSLNGNPVGIGDSINLTISQDGYAVVSFAGCFGTSSIDAGSDTIVFLLDNLNINDSRQISPCYNIDENELYVEFVQNNEPLLLTWFDSLGNVLQVSQNVFQFDTLKNVAEGSYKLHVVKPSGCEFEITYQMPKRQIVPDFTVSPNMICQSTPVNFTNITSGSYNNQSWGFGDGISSTDSNTTHIYQDFGLFDVILTVWNDTFDCMISDTMTIVVNGNIIANFNSSDVLCETETLYLLDESLPLPISWEWSYNNNIFSTEKETEIVFNQPGTYDISLVVTDSLCGIDSITKTYVINSFPIVNIVGDTFFCPGERVILDAGNPGLIFNWSSGQVTQTITMEIYETQVFSVTVDNQGCKTTDYITVNANCNFYFPNAFSPNRDGFNDRYKPHLVNMLGYEMFIYNRWGELIYNYRGYGDSSVDEGWDGTIFGDIAPIGTYVFTAVGTTISGNILQEKGNFVLLR